MNFSPLEFDLAVLEGKERVVAADTDVETRVEFGAALANDDGAGCDRLPTVCLDAAILWIAVATVRRGALSFFMCHKSPLLLM